MARSFNPLHRLNPRISFFPPPLFSVTFLLAAGILRSPRDLHLKLGHGCGKRAGKNLPRCFTLVGERHSVRRVHSALHVRQKYLRSKVFAELCIFNKLRSRLIPRCCRELYSRLRGNHPCRVNRDCSIILFRADRSVIVSSNRFAAPPKETTP